MEKNDVEQSTMKKIEQITYATRQMIPQLTQIWIEAFGDEKEYVDFYFTNRFCETDMLVYLLDGEPVSMISMLPAYLRVSTDSENVKVTGMRRSIRYIYAVATLIAYRGRGYARKLIEEAYRILQVPLVLEPATEQLFQYYQHMGFRSAFSVSEYCISTREDMSANPNVTMRAAEFMQTLDDISDIQTDETLHNPSGSKLTLSGTAIQGEAGMTISLTGASQRYWLLTVTPREYKKIRDEKLAVAGYAEWDENAIAYALLENDYCGGFAYKVFHDNIEDILMYRMDGNRMRIIETTLSDADILGVLAKLRMTPDTIVVRRPVMDDHNSLKNMSGTLDSDSRVFGMILGEPDIQKGYLNLTLE